MAKLTITDNQEAVIQAVETALEPAFVDGVQDQAANNVLNAMEGYSTLAALPDPLRGKVKQPFKALVAAMLTALNIPRALPTGLSTTVTLAKLTTNGSTGSLTFVDGLLTAKVDPT